MYLRIIIDNTAINTHYFQFVISTASNNSIFNLCIIKSSCFDNNIIHVIVTKLCIFEAECIYISFNIWYIDNFLYTTFYFKNDIIKVFISTTFETKQHFPVNSNPSTSWTVSAKFGTLEIAFTIVVYNVI